MELYIVLQHSLQEGFMQSGQKVYGPDTYWMCKNYVDRTPINGEHGYITVSSRSKYKRQ